MIGNGIITNVDLGNKFELGTKLDPTWNFFRKKFEAKRKIPLKKMITQRQWENLSLNGKREKEIDAWWEQGNLVFPMCWTYKENWTLSVLKNMASSN